MELNLFQTPTLTRERIWAAYATAIVTDVLQFLAGPVGWAGADEILDVIAMGVTWRLLGFHPLLLPSFALEFLPITGMLPTWTGCVALVVALRKRKQTHEATQGPVIDAEARRVD